MNYKFDPNWYRREMIKMWRRMLPVMEKRLQEHNYPVKGGRAKLVAEIQTGYLCLARYERIEEKLAQGEVLPSWELL